MANPSMESVGTTEKSQVRFSFLLVGIEYSIYDDAMQASVNMGTTASLSSSSSSDVKDQV